MLSTDNRGGFPRHPEAVEIELIRSLFHAFAPSLVMTLSFIAAGSAIYARVNDGLLLALLIVASLTSIARLFCASLLAKAARSMTLSYVHARRLERYFAIPYIGFAFLLGMFGLRAFMLPDEQVHMVVMCLLIVYAAGVAVGIGLRLWIAVPSMLLALVPVLMNALLTPDALYRVAGGLVGATLVSGVQSLRARHERSVQDIGMRITFSNLARKDALTALPNRIALREWYEERLSAGREDDLIAVHYLDLNGFKPVNDQHGHPVGDALLTAVGKRIGRTIRDTDIVARLGGDEFAVVQYGINSAEEAAQLADRLCHVLSQSFRIGTINVAISTGLGYVVSRGKADDLDDLLRRADQALYASKRVGEAAQYDVVESLPRRTA